jgi:hypothetical protein
MRTIILSLLLDLTLSSSVSAAPARREAVAECTRDTLHAECIAEITTEKLGIPVKVAVKGKCYPEVLTSGASGRVSDPRRLLFSTGISRILARVVPQYSSSFLVFLLGRLVACLL